MLRRYVGHQQSVNCCSFLGGRGAGQSRLLLATGAVPLCSLRGGTRFDAPG